MAETADYIQTLQAAIWKAYGVEAEHLESTPIEEVFQGTAVWKGTVETFLLSRHPQAKFCYAWGHAEKDIGNEVRIVTVLGVSPAISPRSAVRVSIVADAQGGKTQK